MRTLTAIHHGIGDESVPGMRSKVLRRNGAAKKRDFNVRNRAFVEPYMETRQDKFYTRDYQQRSIRLVYNVNSMTKRIFRVFFFAGFR